MTNEEVVELIEISKMKDDNGYWWYNMAVISKPCTPEDFKFVDLKPGMYKLVRVDDE